MKTAALAALLLLTSTAARAEEEPVVNPVGEFARTRVGFDGINIDTEDPRHLSSWTSPFLGDQHASLEGEAFYREVGRPDLADRFHARSNLRLALGAVGGGIIVAALVPLAYGIHNQADMPEAVCQTRATNGSCVSTTIMVSNDALLNGGIEAGVIAGVGLIIALIGYGLESQPIDAVEAHELAARHNRGLRARLGLSSVTVTPSLSHQSAALQLRVAF